jgi:hypothetical protein
MSAFVECPSCGVRTATGEANCVGCGRPVAGDWPAGRPVVTESRAETGAKKGAAIAVIGLMLLLFGALRWSSMESQLIRAFGGSGGLGAALLLAGALGIVVGASLYFSRPSGSEGPSAVSPAPAPSVEARLRQLDELRSKGLITDADYEQRKREILAAL